MWLYLARLSSNDGVESFLKVGVTSYDPKSRLSFGSKRVMDSDLSLREKAELVLRHRQTYVPDIPYQNVVLHSVRYKLAGDALLAEQLLLKVVHPFQYWPKMSFSGRTECFQNDGMLDEIVQQMDIDSELRNREAPNPLIYKVNEARCSIGDPIAKHLEVLKRCKSSSSSR